MKTFRSLDGAKGEKKHFYQVKEGNKKKKKIFFCWWVEKEKRVDWNALNNSRVGLIWFNKKKKKAGNKEDVSYYRGVMLRLMEYH
jgi:hypothetical protein